MKVLIVEDESLVAMEMSQCIKKSGFEVCGIANNPQEAYELANKYKPQIIIMDINLSAEENGVDVVFNLSKTQNFSVIYISAYHDKSTLEEVARTEFVQYIIKPFKQVELISTLKLTQMRCTTYEDGLGNGYTYNPYSKELKLEKKKISLTQNESQLFDILYCAKENLVNLATIDYEIWQNKIISTTTRRTLLHRLRQKIPQLEIRKESNMGYKLIIS